MFNFIYKLLQLTFIVFSACSFCLHKMYKFRYVQKLFPSPIWLFAVKELGNKCANNLAVAGVFQ